MSDNRAGQQPAPRPTSLMQKLVIAVLVVGVGILFGMGGSLALLKGGGPTQVAEGIDQTDVSRHVRLLEQEYMLRGQPLNLNDQRLQAQVRQWALQDLIMAQRAEAVGLMPQGETRQALVRNFLRTELPGENRTMFDAIRDLRGTENEIDIGQLKEYLAVQQASAAYRSRNLPVPAVSDASGRLLAHIQQDQVETDEVVLSTAQLVDALREEVAADEAAVEDTYQELKFERFRIPEAIRLQVLAADADTIAKAVSVNDAAVQAYYDANQGQFTVPPETPADGEAGDAKAEATVKPLEDVRAEIVETLQREKAQGIVTELMDRLDAAIEAQGLHEAPDAEALAALAATIQIPAEDPRVSEAVGITVYPQVRADKPRFGSTLRLKQDDGVGSQLALIRDANFYDKPAGFVSLPIAASDDDGLQFIVHLTERVPADFQPLTEVRETVVDYLAARRAYPTLLERAQEFRVAAKQAGGLSAYATESVLEPWQASLKQASYGPLEELTPPAAEIDGIPEEPLLAIELAGAERIVVVDAGRSGDHYQVKVVQTRDYESADLDPSVVDRSAQQYRRQLETFLGTLFNEQLQAEE